MDIQAKTYFLLGYYGRGNVGDDAILSSFLSRFSSEGTFLVLPSRKRAIPAFRLLRSLFLTLRSDGLILVGGNLLQNRTSGRSLLFYLSVMRFAEALGKTVTVYGGIGEITGNRAKARTAAALSRANALYLRSRNDQKIAAELLAAKDRQPPVSYFPDPVLFLPTVPKTARRFAVLILKRAEDQSEHLTLISRLSSFSPVLLGLSEEDRPYLSDLSARSSLPLKMPKNADETLSVLLNAAFCVSERYHGGIFSLLSMSPCFLSADSQKCEGLIADVSLAAEKTGAALPLFGYGKTASFDREKAPTDRGGECAASAPGKEYPPIDGVFSDLSFLQEKIGGISASDFEKVIGFLRNHSDRISLP